MTEPRRPVFWYQGLFLQPHHFQHADLFTQSLLSPFRQYLQPCFWGVCRMSINQTSLSEGTFELSEGQFIFQDGTWVSLGGNARVKPRSFKDVPRQRGSLKVCLGLHKWKEDRPNVVSLTDRDAPPDADCRFVSGPETHESVDLYERGPTANLKLLDYALRLFWETEKEEAGEFLLLPIAQIDLDTRNPELSGDFVPPVVTIGASDVIFDAMRSIRSLLQFRSRLLAPYKDRKALTGTQVAASTFTFFLVLRSLNRYIPLLAHMAEVIDLHPWSVYGVLRQLVGELSSFSEQYDALGGSQDASGQMPPYDHENLGPCFKRAALLIDEMLGAIVGGMETSVTLERDGEYFRRKIPAYFFDEPYVYYLQIKSSESRKRLVDMAGHVVKLGSEEEIELLMSRALPGIRLEAVKESVPGLVEGPHVLHMRVDTASRHWEGVLKSRTICLYWKDAPEDMTAALVIARRQEEGP